MKLVPRKRTALDGRMWWVVYNTDLHKYSNYTCFGIYRTKKACQIAIDYYSVAWGLANK